MVSRLYEIIEKDGLRDPYSHLPAINFIKRERALSKSCTYILRNSKWRLLFWRSAS
jgi:hypothetical protein